MNPEGRGLRTTISRQEQEDLLKKYLHQQGKCLLIYPEGSNTSLMTALAQTIHASQQSLHEKLYQRLERDLKNYTLPQRLAFIYEDEQVLKDFKSHPQLVNFAKITLELFSASTERRLNLYHMVTGGEGISLLACKIINNGGYQESISIARIDNKYYNIKEKDIESKHELSLDDVFKSSPHIDSDELIETFKSEVKKKHIKSIIPAEPQSARLPQEDSKSSGKPDYDLEPPDLLLKRAKSSIPFNEQKQEKELTVDFDRATVNDSWSLKRQENQLINECGPGHDNFEGFHQNLNGRMMTPEQMYYMYYQNQSQFYQGKGQGYMNYSQLQATSLSPAKSNSFKPPASQNYYPPSGTFNNTQMTSQGSEKRYTGRLKFFDDAKNYGFIIMDADESDIFVHYDDLQKAGITKEVIKTVKNDMYLQIRFSFKVMEYFGKYKKSRKAVELIIIDDELSLLTNGYPLPE